MCRTLRLLNALRDYTVGLPLSYTQYPFVELAGYDAVMAKQNRQAFSRLVQPFTVICGVYNTPVFSRVVYSTSPAKVFFSIIFFVTNMLIH